MAIIWAYIRYEGVLSGRVIAVRTLYCIISQLYNTKSVMLQVIIVR